MPWLFIFLLLLAGFLVGGLSGAPWVPARNKDIEALLDTLKLKPGQLVIELGSGDGRVITVAAKHGLRCVGYEINPLLWLISFVRCVRYYPRAKVRLANFWRRDLSTADAVITFLVPRTMNRLEKKADKEIAKGTVLASYVFKLPNRPITKRVGRWVLYEF